jgi:hypothetical protein
VWVSFDDGANWQSLQCNLPVTPVYDLVVKDDDLVVATHGRSFWILDDLTQLRQISDDLDGAARYLFKPHDTVRTPPDLFGSFWGSPGGKNYHVTIGQNATYYVDEDDTGHTRNRVIDAGDDLERGVRITYLLDEDATGTATLTISDADGNEIDTFTSDVPKEKKDREGKRYIHAKPGMNTFQWNMKHSSGVKMVDTEYHLRPEGPLAKPGTYRATLTVGDWSTSQTFDLVKDPRVTATDEELAEQFDLMMQIHTKLSETATAVNSIRSVRKQLTDWKSRLSGDDRDEIAETIASATALDEALTSIEHELVQVELTSDGDSLNFREMLYEKLGALAPVVSSADARPTVQSHQVYEKLSGQIDEQLAELKCVVDGDLAAFNRRLADLELDIVGT